ncbi:SDR family NAD(P)-dependent oxidoreductase [Sandaracinus amylolyticus]|uniref:3-oxoacyl-[acyl-carrier protein] reductase n=1 Tax=Sandaracinus amylolyticus TaxID=927083 RepID=A0A0F6YHL1_9BACT|nr:SDR family oxidoreductase [Sandaracinus amylolyticus]AKF05820.1 3-oxoacyl-[acyl-carrier protein] reductase [Sandaracinus amylolyticus]
MRAVESVIVTGASRGIGRATAERLIASGRRVAAVARDARALDALVAGSGGRAVAIDADLASPDALRTVVPRAIEALGDVDALVSCAGIAKHRPLAAIDEALFDEHVALNVRAPLFLSRDLARHLDARDASGAIVHLASTLALQGVAGTSVYAATKGAIVALARTLAIELAPRVRVSCIAPGAVDTEMIRAPRSEESLRELAALHPVGRIGTADEIAEAAEYLLEARFATGTLLVLDGGLTAA